MILDSMTFDDVYQHFQLDKDLLNHKIEQGNKIFSRYTKGTQNTKRIYYKPTVFTSNRGLQYVIQFFCRAISEPEKERLGLYYYVTYVQKRGRFAFIYSLMNKKVWHLTLYTPHFFERYRKRFLNDPTISISDVVEQFFRNNQKKTGMKMTIPSKKHPNECWESCYDGLCLCENPSGVFVIAKTFIPWEMARIDQKQFAIEGQQAIIDMGFEQMLPEEHFEEYELEE